MELRVLRYFLKAAKEENITRAAGKLHISQPSLSRQLIQLEDSLGLKLFERGGHKLVLTEEGRLLRRRAQEIVALAEKAEQELHLQEEAISGEIAIGCAEARNMVWLSRRMASFREQYPEVSFEIYTGIADEVKERMENGTLDFGLLVEPVEISQYHFIRLPQSERWCILVRKDSPLAEKERVIALDLAEVPLLMAKRKSVRNELENWFGEVYSKLNIAACCNLSYSNRSIMVEQNLGAALVHEFDNHNENLRLIPLWPEVCNTNVFVWKKGQVFSPASRKYLEWVNSPDDTV